MRYVPVVIVLLCKYTVHTYPPEKAKKGDCCEEDKCFTHTQAPAQAGEGFDLK